MSNNKQTATKDSGCVLMTGNEAIARGVYEAGVHFASAYPGTPSTEIMENIGEYKEIHAQWSPNEKVAMEFAIGCATAGARAFSSMKHVGMNVAADPLLTVAYCGATAGLVVLTADEPGMHSSQNEQDNRNYARMAKLPLLEPSDSQECLDMVKQAYDIFDQFGAVVLIRMTTRVCHSKSIVRLSPRAQIAIAPYVKNTDKFVCVPANARQLRVQVEERLDQLKEYAENTSVNYIENNNASIGVIASGMCACYAKECFGNRADLLKLGFTYPLPMRKIADFIAKHDKVYVIEENDQLLEDACRTIDKDKIFGKYTPYGERFLPAYGELTSDVLSRVIFGTAPKIIPVDPEKTVARPPALCAGCPHRGFFYTVGKYKDVVIAGDIGCYTLGFAPPYFAMDFNNCMGASVSSGAGMQQAFDLANSGKRVISVIGDSTFFHSGMTSLAEVVYNRSNNIIVILDNRITGMTGHQQNPGTGYTLQGRETKIIDIEGVVRALGIERVRIVNPNNLTDMKDALDQALACDQASVIITKYPCLLKKFSQQDKTQYPDAYKSKCVVERDKCVGCKMCLNCGCPAICLDADKKAHIDESMCVGCTVCAQVCRLNAITLSGGKKND